MKSSQTELNSSLSIRISSKLKEAFDTVCKENAVNQSALLRKWITEYIGDNTDKLKE